MSAIRDEIRAILREEIATLRSAPSGPVTETVQIITGADLTRFACEIVARAKDPAFAADVANGRVRFDIAPPDGGGPRGTAIVTSPARPQGPELDKALITERDIAELAADRRILRIGKASRLTPLAQDEARRRGIRIERSAS
ncbi:MAG: hypothetical protein KDE11_05565 [Rhodobacteraceae bacterium]|nr:hypothetical protein [Paracoccaceae bacterium]